jgi:phenylpropionate dioxygenase-like ring-hydroxylating dioxygenase large terminal subunit
MLTEPTSITKFIVSLAIIVVVTDHGGNAFVIPPTTPTRTPREMTGLFSVSSSSSPSKSNMDTTSRTTVGSSSGTLLFENFDYQSRWYPVIWARDLLTKEPTKVTVFDVDYVVAKMSDTEVMALEDQCPHKAASLSEGRITETGNFQCAYHGWAFDGETGTCQDIPQVAQTGDKNSSRVVFPSRSCAKAIPAQIHQEMVYLFVGGSMEEALIAPPPPTVLEYDTLGFRMSCSIRDMPVDWPIVGKVLTSYLVLFIAVFFWMNHGFVNPFLVFEK